MLNQNALTLKRLEFLDINLEEIQEKLQETKKKLYKALPDRNVDPEMSELNYQFILLKDKLFLYANIRKYFFK